VDGEKLRPSDVPRRIYGSATAEKSHIEIRGGMINHDERYRLKPDLC
jgi:hypothetical protein